jgi:hypothetical protein
VGVEPSTYALRVGSRVRDEVTNARIAAWIALLSAACCWQFMVVRGHVGDILCIRQPRVAAVADCVRTACRFEAKA